MARVAGRLPAWALALLCAAGPVAAQTVPPGDVFTDSYDVSAVLIPVTVRDAKGVPIAHLTQDRFDLRIDGIRFPIRSFWREGGLPLSLAFVVDVSGSMNGRRLAQVQAVVAEFLRQFRSDDEVSLITFGADEVRRVLPFGAGASRVGGVVDGLKGYGTTALFDTVSQAPLFMEGARHDRRAIVLFTDGVDTASQLGGPEAARILESLNEPLYGFGIEPPPPEPGQDDSYEALLTRLADASGGRYLKAATVAELGPLARQLRRELSARYIIAFQPSGVGSVQWRRIEVLVKGRYQVFAREGYRGTLP
jgi:Ca-activated chloride channel family protein